MALSIKIRSIKSTSTSLVHCCHFKPFFFFIFSLPLYIYPNMMRWTAYWNILALNDNILQKISGVVIYTQGKLYTSWIYIIPIEFNWILIIWKLLRMESYQSSSKNHLKQHSRKSIISLILLHITILRLGWVMVMVFVAQYINMVVSWVCLCDFVCRCFCVDEFLC